MTREEQIDWLCRLRTDLNNGVIFTPWNKEFTEALNGALEQEPKFIAKSDGTIEQMKNCNDCLFKKEWEKIGKLLSVVLEKQVEQEPKTGHWNDIPEYKDIAWRCSECKHFAAMKHNYCPCCGAKMVEPQGSGE